MDRFDQFWAREIKRRKKRNWSRLATATGGLGAVGTLPLFVLAFNAAAMSWGLLGMLIAFIASLCAGSSSMWLTVQGLKGMSETQPLPPPPGTQRPGRKRGGEKSIERQLLEVIERHGEITPARAALETSLTVDEAEGELSRLAQKGHIDVRVEGGKLVYVF